MARRTALIGLVALVFGALPAAGRAAPGANVEVMQIADAGWTVREADGRAYYFALALRVAPAPTAGFVTFAVVGKGRCVSFKDKNSRMMMCSASGRGHVIPFEDFEIDPLLDSARLTLEARGFTNEVEWGGGGELPETQGGVGIGQYGVGVGAAMGRWATASGEVLGQEVRSRGFDFAFLMQGGAISAYLDDRGIRIHDDGRVSVRRLIRL